MIYDRLLTEEKNIRNQIDALQKKIAQLPEGKLLCAGNKNYVKWYKSNGSNPVYIPKRDRKLAESLALKKFYQLQVADLTAQLQTTEALLVNAKEQKSSAFSLLSENSYFSELLQPYFHSFSDELQQWVNEEYEHNPVHVEYLVHQTLAGFKVRSKSEVLISNALFTNKIPFRYECALVLSDILFYPDFTIRHPTTGETIYWEHFGLMDQPAYSEKAFNKLKIYAANNMIPSINLITTWETRKSPISSEKIQQIIEEYFC